jgi:Family of unknown function (DUF6247)
VVAMTAAGQPHPIPAIPPLPEGAGPRAIRAALLAEEREEFDQSYRQALSEAGDTLELAGVLATLEHWRRAIMSADPQAYRRMLRRTAQLLSGGDPLSGYRRPHRTTADPIRPDRAGSGGHPGPAGSAPAVGVGQPV